MRFLIVLLACIASSLQYDSVMWTNDKQMVDRLDTDPLQKFVDKATVKQPVVLFLVDKAVISSGRGYTSRSLDGQIQLDTNNPNIRHYADGMGLENASVVVVRSDNMDMLNNNIAEIMKKFADQAYVAVITDSNIVRQHKISKRQATDDKGDKAKDEPTAPSTGNEAGYNFNGKTCLFTADQLYFLSSKGSKANQWVMLEKGSATTEGKCDDKNAQFTITAKSPTDLKLKFVVDLTIQGTKFLYDMNCKEERQLRYVDKFGANSVDGFCFMCGKTTPLFAQRGDDEEVFGVYFTKIGIQPFSVVDGKFSDRVDDCVPYFSEASWMGIIVGLLMLFIVLASIGMLGSLQTNDRFDDPKGKQLQTNVKGE